MGDQIVVGIATDWRAIDVLAKGSQDHPRARDLPSRPCYAVARRHLLETRGFKAGQPHELTALDEFERSAVDNLYLAK